MNNLSVFCPRCNSKNLYKYGFQVVDDSRYQKYQCKDCKRQFAPDAPTNTYVKRNYPNCPLCKKGTFLHHDYRYYSNFRCNDKKCNHSFKVAKPGNIDPTSSNLILVEDHFKGFRFPSNIILAALNLSYIGKCTSRDISLLLKQLFNVDVSHVTVNNWVTRFAGLFKAISDELTRSLDFNSDEWHLDETVIKIAGKKHYIWLAIDSETRFVLDYHLSPSRSSDESHSLVNSIKDMGSPKSIVTDRYKAYIQPISLLMSDCTHITVEDFKDEISNNLIESFFSQFKSWYKNKRGFECFESANRAIMMYIFYYNFVLPHSSLDDLTPAEVAGLNLSERDKWRFLIAA